MTLPVSVVIPHRKDRAWFLQGWCLPAIRANDVAQIIVIDQKGSPAINRNAGAAKADQKYLLFVDDDCVLRAGAVNRLLQELETDSLAGFAYGDFIRVVGPGAVPQAKPERVPGHPFDVNRLKQRNYITISALMRRELFKGFDTTLTKFEDWDLWLTLAGQGVKGVYIPMLSHVSFVIDQGVTHSAPDSMGKVVKKKHSLDTGPARRIGPRSTLEGPGMNAQAGPHVHPKA